MFEVCGVPLGKGRPKPIIIAHGFDDSTKAAEHALSVDMDGKWADVFVRPEPPKREIKRRPSLAETAEKDFALLVAAAVAGERCPQTNPHGPLHSDAISKLMRLGKIRSEVYMHNYRVVTILVGEHAGRSTYRPPHLGPPYRVNGRYR